MVSFGFRVKAYCYYSEEFEVLNFQDDYGHALIVYNFQASNPSFYVSVTVVSDANFLTAGLK